MSSAYVLHTQDPEEGVVKKYKQRSTCGLVFAFIFLVLTVVFVALYISASSSSSSSSSSPPPPPVPPPSSNAAQVLRSNITSIMRAAMNTTVDPCQDYYEYACGGWLSRTKIPDDKSQVYWVIDDINDANQLILKNILEDVLDWPWLSSYYSLCMNTSSQDALGLAPVNSLLAEVNNLDVAVTTDLFSTLGRLHAIGAQSLFSFSSAADLLNPALNVGQLNCGGFFLGDKSAYNASDPLNSVVLSAYLLHISDMFSLFGFPASQASSLASSAYLIESALADLSLSSVDQRSINATYNRLDAEGVIAATQGEGVTQAAWLQYWNAIGYTVSGNATTTTTMPINVQSPKYLKAVAHLIKTANPQDLKAYLLWTLMHATAPYLTTSIQLSNWNFFQGVLNAAAAPPAQWRTCVSTVDALLGQSLGRYYVKEAFSVAGKQTATAMMNTVLASMSDKLNTVAWMDNITKAKAHEKLQLFREQIGWPDHWEEFSGLSLSHKSYFEDTFDVVRWTFNQQIQSIAKPVNRNIWTMTTPTVNAYYDPSSNQIVIPAGILQGLYFNALFHPAVNYGGTGGTMGHEMTHGFDDQGAQFDGHGAFLNWWSPSTLDAFHQRTQCLADYYAAFVPDPVHLPGLHIDGTLTLGENIADVGGIKQAYKAYTQYMNQVPAPTVPGLNLNEPYFNVSDVPDVSNSKLFFLSYAQGWCVSTRTSSLKNQLASNPHSPGKFRVNGPLAQFDEFGKLYNCPVGSPMRPQPTQICDVW